MARDRTCSACAESLPMTEDFFPRSSSNKSGFESTCKLCRYGVPARPQLHQKHVRRYRNEPPPRRQEICDTCGSLPWRVEGERCVECGIEHREEKAVELAYCQAFHVSGVVFPNQDLEVA